MPRVHFRFARALVLLVFLLFGCAGGTGGEIGPGPAGSFSGPEVRVDETLPSIMAFPYATVESVWRVLPAAFEALGIPAGVIDPSARIYGNGVVRETSVAGRPTRDLFRCSAGSGLSLGQYRVQFGIAAQPRPMADGGTELFLQIEAFGRRVNASQSGTTHCVSNGILEMRLKEQVEAELARIGG